MSYLLPLPLTYFPSHSHLLTCIPSSSIYTPWSAQTVPVDGLKIPDEPQVPDEPSNPPLLQPSHSSRSDVKSDLSLLPKMLFSLQRGSSPLSRYGRRNGSMIRLTPVRSPSPNISTRSSLGVLARKVFSDTAHVREQPCQRSTSNGTSTQGPPSPSSTPPTSQ